MVARDKNADFRVYLNLNLHGKFINIIYYKRLRIKVVTSHSPFCSSLNKNHNFQLGEDLLDLNWRKKPSD